MAKRFQKDTWKAQDGCWKASLVGGQEGFRVVFVRNRKKCVVDFGKPIFLRIGSIVVRMSDLKSDILKKDWVEKTRQEVGEETGKYDMGMLPVVLMQGENISFSITRWIPEDMR